MTKSVFVTGGSGYIGHHLIPALISEGHRVVAMARSEEAAARVNALGAHAQLCNLDDRAGLTESMRGCWAVVHAASRFMEGGGYREYQRDNVEGAANILAAAREAEVRRFVYVGAAGCLVGPRPIRDADESWPLQVPRYSPYFRTKSIADRMVRQANTTGFTTSVVRPGLIWGGEDDTFLAPIAEATRSGQMMFIDGGRHDIVTSHVDNTVRGIICALNNGTGGQAYFIFDDGTVTLRSFLGRLLETRGLVAPNKTIPFRVAWIMATVMEGAWRVLRRPGSPPMNRDLVKLNGGPFVISDRKAREELGYVPSISRDAGIAAMRNSVPPSPVPGSRPS